MPFTAARKSTGITTLLFLLVIILLFGCRSPEPTTEKKAADKETLRLIPASAPPAPVHPEPIIVSEEPDPPATAEKMQAPESSPPGKEELTVGEKKRPRVAIIIDDMGHHRQLGRQLLHLDLNLTYSFLPDAPYTAEQAEAAFQNGRDILAHLPMEPKDAAWNLGPEALTVQDVPKKIREKVERMLAAVPHATGANNHMGSRFTEDAGAMQVVIETLRSRSFFFIDSFTTAASQGWTKARQLEVPTARRHIFLDNVQEPKKICRQIEQLISQAKKRDGAIGIGHPNKAMLTALTQCDRDQLREVEIVGIHQLVQ